MDGGNSARFDRGEAFVPGLQPAKGRFVAQPGLTAPDAVAGFTRRSPAAMVAPQKPAQVPAEAVAAVPAPPPAAPEPAEAPAPQAVMPRQPVPSAAQLAEVRAIALAEGRALGLQDAETALRAEREHLAAQARVLSAAVARLAEPPVAEVDALARTIAAAVARLASERAGQAIDTAPGPFARRIARLAERVAQGMRDVAIHLHPDDLAAVSPLVAGACPPDLTALVAARLVPDAGLMRGDADLRAPGLRVADLSGDTTVPFPAGVAAA
jgi:flagellar assembly protein FliH